MTGAITIDRVTVTAATIDATGTAGGSTKGEMTGVMTATGVIQGTVQGRARLGATGVTTRILHETAAERRIGDTTTNVTRRPPPNPHPRNAVRYVHEVNRITQSLMMFQVFLMICMHVFLSLPNPSSLHSPP